MAEIKINYIGKSLLIENDQEKILVIGDLHLGFEESLRQSGIMLPVNIFEEVKKDFDEIFKYIEERSNDKVRSGVVGSNLVDRDNRSKMSELSKRFRVDNSGKKLVDKVILLGDVKHEFGKIMRDEWKEVGEVFNYLRRKCKEIIVVKGNHDVLIDFVASDLSEVRVVNYYFLGDIIFLHGDRDFEEIYDKKIKCWIVGHGHPAITLEEKKGVKKEKYKCFLSGSFKGKKIIIVPSFFDVNEGTDARSFDLGLAWDFNLDKFDVKVVSDDGNLEVLDFGELHKL